MNSPQIDGVVSSDSSKTSTGENLSEMPEGRRLISATVLGGDLQRKFGSLPVEDRFGNQVDTHLNCEYVTEW